MPAGGVPLCIPPAAKCKARGGGGAHRAEDAVDADHLRAARRAGTALPHSLPPLRRLCASEAETAQAPIHTQGLRRPPPTQRHDTSLSFVVVAHAREVTTVRPLNGDGGASHAQVTCPALACRYVLRHSTIRKRGSPHPKHHGLLRAPADRALGMAPPIQPGELSARPTRRANFRAQPARAACGMARPSVCCVARTAGKRPRRAIAQDTFRLPNVRAVTHPPGLRYDAARTAGVSRIAVACAHIWGAPRTSADGWHPTSGQQPRRAQGGNCIVVTPPCARATMSMRRHHALCGITPLAVSYPCCASRCGNPIWAGPGSSCFSSTRSPPVALNVSQHRAMDNHLTMWSIDILSAHPCTRSAFKTTSICLVPSCGT